MSPYFEIVIFTLFPLSEVFLLEVSSFTNCSSFTIFSFIDFNNSTSEESLSFSCFSLMLSTINFSLSTFNLSLSTFHLQLLTFHFQLLTPESPSPSQAKDFLT